MFLFVIFFQIISLLVIVSVHQVTLSKPINNGFTLKFNPISVKEEVKHKTFGALFAKIPQESTDAANKRQEIPSKAYLAHTSELGTGCTNQIARIFFPFKSSSENNSLFLDANYINIPIIQQPFADYKIVVATAPTDIKISGPEAKPLVVYIVFPEEDASDAKSITIPSVYFIRKQSGLPDLKEKDKVDPILIVDNNRTVTGLKSKEVAKFVKFKNRFTNRFNYELDKPQEK